MNAVANLTAEWGLRVCSKRMNAARSVSLSEVESSLYSTDNLTNKTNNGVFLILRIILLVVFIVRVGWYLKYLNFIQYEEDSLEKNGLL